MDLLLVLALGLLIGAVLGGLGGGGAILTVPALVYVVGQPAQTATTGSLVIVGLTALVGAVSYLAAGRVRWGTGLVFGLVGLPAALLGSWANHRVDPDLLLLGFSVLMLVAAAAMLGGRPAPVDDVPDRAGAAVPAGSGPGSGGTLAAVRERVEVQAATRAPSRTAVVAAAAGVGLLTGFFGVGGGFVILPALVLVLRLPMQVAVGTSLLVVALNSGSSLLARVGSGTHLDWGVVVPFTVAAMLATLAGKRVADRLPARQLRRGFALLLVLVAGYTAWQSASGLVHGTDTPSAGAASSATTGDATSVVTPAEAAAAVADGAVLLDVRTPEEFAAGHLAEAVNIDSASTDLTVRLDALDPEAAYVVYCASGRRAAGVVQQLADLGVTDVVNGGGFTDLAPVLPTS